MVFFQKSAFANVVGLICGPGLGAGGAALLFGRAGLIILKPTEAIGCSLSGIDPRPHVGAVDERVRVGLGGCADLGPTEAVCIATDATTASCLC